MADVVDARAFGVRLRESTEQIAKGAVDGRLEAFGRDVETWAERAVDRKVAGQILEMVRPVLSDVAKVQAQAERLAKTMEGHERIISKLDGERIAGDYAELQAMQERLQKQRTESLAEARTLAAAATQVLGATKTAEALGEALAKSQVAMRGEMAEMAKAAATEAVEVLRYDVEALAREAMHANLDASRSELQAAVSKATRDFGLTPRPWLRWIFKGSAE